MEPKNIGPGRPKGTGRDTKAKIGKIASKQFSEIGYEKTTIRSVAEASGVDPKLVMHYFGNKEKLFASTMSLPHEASAALTLLGLIPKRQWGARISDVVWLSKNSKTNKVMVGVIRASASEEKAAEMLREFYTENLFNPMLSALKVDSQEIRSVMLSSLMVGYTFNNEILDLFEHLGVSDKKSKGLFAKTVQTILTAEF